MNLILLIACMGMITGCLVLLSLPPMEFTNHIFQSLISKPHSIRDEINEATGRKKMSFFKREVTEIESILKITGREHLFPLLCAWSLILFAIGASVAILLENFFLVPVLAGGFLFLPFWYVRLTQAHYKKDIAAELETALSIITTAYLRNDDILTAVETYWRLLELVQGGSRAEFEFQKNQYSTYQDRTHFTPIWMPDGSYIVNTWVIDAWTPVGMMSQNLTNSITIKGSLWDDWHIAPQAE